jgi:hypothetical protein
MSDDEVTRQMGSRIAQHRDRFQDLFEKYFAQLHGSADAPELSRFAPECLHMVEELALRGGKRQRVAFAYAAELDLFLATRGVSLLRPSYRNRGTPQGAEDLLKTVRQLIESVNDTLKGQLDLEQHGGRTIEGVGVRVAQRILAMTCAIWHNRATGAPITRSLIAYDSHEDVKPPRSQVV